MLPLLSGKGFKQSQWDRQDELPVFRARFSFFTVHSYQANLTLASMYCSMHAVARSEYIIYFRFLHLLRRINWRSFLSLNSLLNAIFLRNRRNVTNEKMTTRTSLAVSMSIAIAYAVSWHTIIT